MAREYLVCPQCGKRRVTLRMSSREDGYGCDRCDWWIFTDGFDRADVEGRTALKAANPDATISEP